MSTLHTFGCSITQGFALPDVVRVIRGADGEPLTNDQLNQQGIKWTDIHLYQPSRMAWPQLLADQLGMSVINHARRGACFQQIARQCAVAHDEIQPEDVVIVMWTYLSRLSLQWPARTSVPYANQVDNQFSWRTAILGLNKWFGLTPDKTAQDDDQIHQHIEQSLKHHYLDPMGQFNRYYNSMVLQQITHHSLTGTGARVIHLSVERDTVVDQLESMRQDLPHSLREPYQIPNPDEWYTVPVDYHSCEVILDPSIPPAENDMHPSVTHHRNFAEHIRKKYF